MRQITTDAIKAFMSHTAFNRDNTSVIVIPESTEDCFFTELAIFGNPIARRYSAGDFGIMTITNAGFKTATTKERLNGLEGVKIHQVAGQWFLNGKRWDGEWEVVEVGDRK